MIKLADCYYVDTWLVEFPTILCLYQYDCWQHIFLDLSIKELKRLYQNYQSWSKTTKSWTMSLFALNYILFNFLATIEGLCWEYVFNINDNVLWPVNIWTSLIDKPLSISLEQASRLRSCQCKSLISDLLVIDLQARWKLFNETGNTRPLIWRGNCCSIWIALGVRGIFRWIPVFECSASCLLYTSPSPRD